MGGLFGWSDFGGDLARDGDERKDTNGYSFPRNSDISKDRGVIGCLYAHIPKRHERLWFAMRGRSKSVECGSRELGFFHNGVVNRRKKFKSLTIYK